MTVNKKADIIVGAKDEASKKLKGIQGSLSGIGAAAVAVNQGLELARKAADFFIDAYNLGKIGAETEKMEFAFEKMAASVGANTDVIIAKVKNLTNNTISDFEIMKNASRLATLGLPIDKIGEFAEIARASAAAMGESTQFMFDSIVTGTARQSKLILDNLGIIISETKVYAAETERLGRELTDAEKKQAFLNAVLREGKKSVDAIGDTTMLTMDSFEQFEAATDNLKRAIASLLSGPLGFIVGRLAIMADNLVNVLTPYESLTEAIRNGQAVWDDYSAVLKETDANIGDFLISIEKGQIAIKKTTLAIKDNIKIDEILAKNLKIFAESYGRVAIDATNTAESIDDVTIKTKEQVEIIEKAAKLTAKEIAKRNKAAVVFFEAEISRLSALDTLRTTLANQEKDRAKEKERLITENFELLSATEEQLTVIRIQEEAKRMIASKKFTDVEVKAFIAAQKAKAEFSQQIENQLEQSFRRAGDTIVDIMFGVRVDLAEVFKDMAKDFIRFFIEEITKKLAAKAAVWVLNLLFFDKRENDLLAIQSGFDFATFFTQGADQGFNFNRIRNTAISSSIPLLSPVGAGMGGGGITINIQGNIIGEDEWVKNRMVPILEEAIFNRETNIDVELI